METKFDYELAKDLAETIAGLYRKMDTVYEVTGWEIYETFPDASMLYYVFLRMVGGVVCDHSGNSFDDYVDGKLTFDELLKEVGAIE